jgi:hypothetical protein
MPDVISPKGMQQSARMRNMRVLFDGPAPSGTIKTTTEPKAPCSRHVLPLHKSKKMSPLRGHVTADVPLSEHARDGCHGESSGKLSHLAAQDHLQRLSNVSNVLPASARRRVQHRPPSKGRPAASPKIDMRSLQDVGTVTGMFENNVPFNGGRTVKCTLVQNLVSRYESNSGQWP